MKAIDGVDLHDLFLEATSDLRKKEVDEAKAKIISIFGAMSQAKGTVTRLRKDLEKAEATLTRWERTLAQLQEGNWEVLEAAPSTSSNEKDKKEKEG